MDNQYRGKIKVKYIGPVTTEWGGIKAGGGVSTYIQGLLKEISYYGVIPELLADNTDHHSQQLTPIETGFEITEFVRPVYTNTFDGIRKLGVTSLIRITYALWTKQDSIKIPFQFILKFIVQAANFNLFLNKGSYDILHVQHAEFRQYLCQNILRVTKPIVITAQSVNIIKSPDEDWKKELAIYNYSRARWIIAVSNYVRDEISRYTTNSTVIEVIPNGVDTESFKPVDKKSIRTKLNLNLENTYLFYSGNLIKRKGVEIMLSAFAQLHEKYPHLRCLVAGKGPEGVSLHKLANQLGIRSKVDFIGFIPISDMQSWYQASDVFIMPSSSEGLSLSVLEALSCGLPVITSKPFIGDHDAVIPGETGLLTPYGNIDNLMEAIETLISSSHRRQEMSHNARYLAKQKFDWKIVAESTANFYHRILTENF